MNKLWQTDSSKTNQHTEEYTVGKDHILDKKLLPYDIKASKAHAEGLKKVGILNQKELEILKKGLDKILDLFQQGEFEIKKEDEDCHTAIENYLIENYGDVGKKIHTGRSRNDQVLVATRLYTKEELKNISKKLIELQEGFLKFAKKYECIALPGFTHTRHAMPSSVGHWSSSYVEEFIDSHQLLESTHKLVDQNPLGSAAGFGVCLDLKRDHTTAKLGFSKTQTNSLYCINSRGKFESHTLSTLTYIMTTLSRFATELIWFTLPEFSYFEITDDITTGSSIMPQKKNPDPLEIIRAKTSKVSSLHFKVQNIIQNLISGYNRDTQLTKEALMKGVEITKDSLQMTKTVLKNTKPNQERLEESIPDYSFATQEALNLVKEGVPYREAYKKIKKEVENLEIENIEERIRQQNSPGAPGNLKLDEYRLSEPL